LQQFGPVPLQLRDNVHWCNCAARAVFLDIEADRYFCLPAASNETFLRLAAGDARGFDSKQLAALVARGILVYTSASGAIRPAALLEQPTRDWATEGTPRAGLFAILHALASELRLARRLRTRPLLELVETARRRQPNDRRFAGDPHRSIERIVGASAAASYVLRVQDRCLVRALAVHSICKKRGVRAKLVLGVIAHPFAAHCWVQLGSTVLVGGFEQARLYTPILVIE
jgi:hypothetical protein